jgi:hypothetical protein
MKISDLGRVWEGILTENAAFRLTGSVLKTILGQKRKS